MNSPILSPRTNFFFFWAGVIVKAEWVDGQGCVITNTNTTVLLATWVYTMTFDFIILLLTAIKLIQPNSRFRSKLVVLVFKDGLIYFIVAYVFYFFIFFSRD